jgi:ribosomal 30S subunit maturation factor RimM
MITEDKVIPIGKIVKKRQDGLVIFFNTKSISSYSKLEFIFVEYGRELIPFFLVSFYSKGDQTAVVEFLDISPAQVDLLIDCTVWLPEKAVDPSYYDKVEGQKIVGYSVVDTNAGMVGTVVAMIDRVQQPLIEVDKNGNLLLIPYTVPIVIKTDHQSMTIYIDAPEGLLSIT